MAPVVECGVCNTNPSKYKCPKCVLRYCSIACFKIHKETPCDQQAPTQPPSAPPPVPTPQTEITEATIQQQQGEGKAEEKPWWHTQNVPVDGAYAKLEHQDDHVVAREDLAKLGESSELRALLQQRDLRELLVQLHNRTAGVRNVGEAEGAIMDALKDPQFAQFADTCLSTLGMKEPAPQVQQ
eukprot:comp16517_c0_seq1/m.14538 comp16517_c0_seq1/g.14538  ORF comp16517_c0_seq1/g.14538 comp16517_c0_seq1/m.14538 type:complete len:183 (-) comp16517_c0_seq1:143-691(-)